MAGVPGELRLVIRKPLISQGLFVLDNFMGL